MLPTDTTNGWVLLCPLGECVALRSKLPSILFAFREACWHKARHTLEHLFILKQSWTKSEVTALCLSHFVELFDVYVWKWMSSWFIAAKLFRTVNAALCRWVFFFWRAHAEGTSDSFSCYFFCVWGAGGAPYFEMSQKPLAVYGPTQHVLVADPLESRRLLFTILRRLATSIHLKSCHSLNRIERRVATVLPSRFTK